MKKFSTIIASLLIVSAMACTDKEPNAPAASTTEQQTATVTETQPPVTDTTATTATATTATTTTTKTQKQ